MTGRAPHPTLVVVAWLGLAAILASCAGGPSEPTGPDLNVTKTEDTLDGACQPRDCSLREAVAAANASPGPHTIHIPAGTYPLSLTGSGEDADATGDLDLTGDVTLVGAGSEADGTLITAPPGFGDRLIHVVSGSAVVENLYLGGGQADSGGAVFVAPSTSVTLRQDRIEAGKATGDGGGLIFNAGTLQVDNTRLAGGCSAGEGGAVLNNGTATFTGATLSDNETVVSGGAIANKGTMSISGTSVARAFAGGGKLCGVAGDGRGGGIFNTGDLTLSGGDVSQTEATLSGGGIFSQGSLNVSGTTVRSVAGQSGGGVTVAAGGRATLTGVDLESTVSHGDGGALFVEAGGTATLADSRLVGTANGNGGGLANSGELVVRTTTITESNAADGAGAYNSGTLTIEDSTIRQNSAHDHGGGVFGLGTTTIDRSTITGNNADLGGGVYLQGSATLTNCTVSVNNGATAGGGAAFSGSGSVRMTHCTLTRNAAPSASGLLVDTFATVSNTVIGGNRVGPNCQVQRGLAGMGNLDEDGSCGFAPTDNVIGVAPELGTLQDNGGPTQTHLLGPNSPARNAGSSAVCLPTDQRGVARPQEGRCDIGSVEMEPGT